MGRAILWKPLPDSYHLLASMMHGSEEHVHLFLTQRAFLQIERHLCSATELELGGFLAGHLYECPRAHLRYSIVNTVVPFAEVSAAAIGSRVTSPAAAAARSRLEAHGLSLIGWYRNASGLGLQLLPDDIEAHLEHFDQPWQTILLVVPDPSKMRGAFFTYDRRVGRAYCVPFYELLGERVEDPAPPRRTCVTWNTYVPSSRVEPLHDRERDAAASHVAPIRLPPLSHPPEPLDEWWDAIKDPWVRMTNAASTAWQRRAERGRGPTARNNISLRGISPTPPITVSEIQKTVRVSELPCTANTANAPSESTPVQRASDVTGPVPRPHLTGAVPQVAREPNELHAEQATRELRPRPAVSPRLPAPRPEVDRPARAAHPKPAVATRAEASNGPTSSSLVALPPDFHDDTVRWHRRRRIAFAMATLSFAGAILIAFLRSPPSRSALAAPSVAAAARSSASAQELDPAESEEPFPVAIDSLADALAHYRNMENDHRAGLVGCRVLEGAYGLVGHARTAVDSARSRIPGGLHAADSIKVSMLGAELTHVTQTYRRSGCGSTGASTSTNGR